MATRKSKLETVFTGDSRPFERTVNRVRATGAKVAGVGRSMAGGFAAIGGAMLFKTGLAKFDRIDKLSKDLDMSAETLQKFGHVADLGGADLETFAKGVKMLNLRASEAAGPNGLKSYRREFEKMGIDVDKFNMLNYEELTARYAKAIKEATDRQTAQAATTKLMGRAGSEMFRIYEQGGTEMRSQMNSVSTLTTDQTAALAKLNDTFTTLSTTGLEEFFKVIAKIWQFMKSIAEWAGIIAGVVGTWAGGATLSESLQAAADTKMRLDAQKEKERKALEDRGKKREQAEAPLVAKKVAKATAKETFNVFDPSKVGGFFGHAGRRGTPVSRQVKSLQEKMLDIGMRSKEEIADMHRTLRNALI